MKTTGRFSPGLADLECMMTMSLFTVLILVFVLICSTVAVISIWFILSGTLPKPSDLFRALLTVTDHACVKFLILLS